MAGTSRGNRTVGLDKPCRACGKPVHYSYVSRIEGLCGKCADQRMRKRPLRRYHRGMALARQRPGGGRRAHIPAPLLITFICLAGAAAVAIALHLLF